jgi:crotonobetainyl-CoA:carnitine CoA-transferase CaiB-like acyl-CoA transferase
MTLALEGVRLIDFGQYLAGPFGPMIIGDLGAEVIKVEPVTGDGMRMATKPFFGCQRGKRDIALNVKDPRGLALALELVGTADVEHHNKTAGVATKLGIDYVECKKVKPDIVYCNTWAYGLEGPLARFGGLDPLYQASAGLEYESSAVHEGNTPLYYRFGMCDASNAMLSIVAVLGALYHRKRTGEGQEVWTSLFDGGAIFTSDAHLVGGEPAPRPHLDKELMGVSATYRLYRTQDDEWICIAAITDDEFRSLCTVLGLDEIVDDTRFVTAASRGEHRRQLESILEPRFRTKTASFWTRTLDDAGVPNEVPLDTHGGENPLFDSDNVELGMVARYTHPIMGDMRQFGQLIDFSETPGHVAGPPPLVGQDTRALLHELGHRDPEIDGLIADGVCYEPDDHYGERFLN